MSIEKKATITKSPFGRMALISMMENFQVIALTEFFLSKHKKTHQYTKAHTLTDIVIRLI